MKIGLISLSGIQVRDREILQDLRKYIIYSVYNFGRSVTISQIDRRLNCLINPLKKPVFLNDSKPLKHK